MSKSGYITVDHTPYVCLDNAGLKFAAAITDLPETGGIVDGRSLWGEQFIYQDIYSNVSKPVTLLTGAARYHTNVQQTLTTTTNMRIEGIGCGGAVGINGSGAATVFVWDGPLNGTVFMFDRARECQFGGFNIIKGTNPIGSAIRIDHLEAPYGYFICNNNQFNSIGIGECTTGVQIGNNSTQNNDEHTFDNVYIHGPGEHGFYIHDHQSKWIAINNSFIVNRNYGIWTDAGSFNTYRLQTFSNRVDYMVNNTTDCISIMSHQSESAQYFFFFPSGTSASFPVTIQCSRVAPDMAKPEFISYHAGGTFQMRGNDFCGGAYTTVPTMNFGNSIGCTVLSEGNSYWRDDIWTNGTTLRETRVFSRCDLGIGANSIPVKLPDIG